MVAIRPPCRFQYQLNQLIERCLFKFSSMDATALNGSIFNLSATFFCISIILILSMISDRELAAEHLFK